MRSFFYLILTTTFLLFSCIAYGQVTLPHLDPINYTVGQWLQTQTGWTSINSGDSLLITSGSLSYSDLETSTGNKVAFDGAGIDAAKSFTQQNTGTVYYSFLLRITSLGSLNNTGGYFTGFNEGTGTNYGATVWLRLDGDGFDIGINPRTTAANTAWSSGTQSLNTTLFIVISYQIVSESSNDVVKLWINPTPGSSEPTATLSATNTGGTDLANLNRILIRQDATTATPFIEMDELRIATSWSSVTPAALPSITLSNTDFTQITAGNVNQGETNRILSRFKVSVATANATLNQISFDAGGTFVAGDVTNFKLFTSTSNSFPGGSAL